VLLGAIRDRHGSAARFRQAQFLGGSACWSNIRMRFFQAGVCPGLSQPTSGSVLPRLATPMLRRSRQEAPLDLAPSERLDRLMEVVGQAYAVFEDPAARCVS